MIEKLKEKYAQTLVRLGMNVQKGQSVMIECAIENHEFAKMVAKYSYLAGAKDVNIVYIDLEKNALDAKYKTAKSLKEIKDYEVMMYEDYLSQNCATIRLESENPYIFEGLSDDYSHAIFSHIDDLRNIMRKNSRNGHQWCIAIVPTKKWAEVIMPNEDKDKVLNKFWEILFKLCLIDLENDPVELWQKKNQRRNEMARKIDSLNLVDLHFTSSNGTDLHVGLTPNSKFSFDYPKPSNYIPFEANIPSEEICTTPNKYLVNGKVCTTRPLLLGGKMIPYFELTFKDGKIVDIKADECKELLSKTIYTDNGSCYLGEVALVEYHSPISMSNLVYYTTLVDENASCHLAFGRGLNGGSGYIDEKGRQCFNDSSIHIDFMIGDKDTNIIGTDKDGNKYQIFKDGDFAL